MGDTWPVTGQTYDDSVTRYICCPEFVLFLRPFGSVDQY